MANYKAKVAWDAGHLEDTFEVEGGKGVIVNGEKFEEHWFNLAVAKKAAELGKYNGIEPVLTHEALAGKSKDNLTTRTNKAKSEKVDLLFSIHADASANANAKGHWVFYWHADTKAKKLAEIWDKWADKLLPNNDRNTVACSPNSWANFHMCRVPASYGIPAILIEHAFMTNLEDLAYLKSEEFRDLCAEAAVRTACEYLGIPFSKPPASAPTKPFEKDPSVKFIDVPKGHWAVNAIKLVSDESIINGFTDGRFGIGEDVTREQLAVVICNLITSGKVKVINMGKPTKFTDVPDNHWAKTSIDVVSAAGIMEGYPDGRFGLGNTVKREELAVVVSRLIDTKK